MAVIGFLEEKGFRRKRKRKITFERRKINAHEKVEVRSVEQGFQGSWHQGTVTALDKRGYRVEYEHLLFDESTDRVVDIVSDSPAIDCVTCPCEKHYNYRGTIRRPPPKLDFCKWNLCYGLCVDVLFNDAWWEGVILDFEDGSEKRRVFFPDLGDEMTVKIENVRITQDWNDFEEEWQRRGTWVFLELVEHYRQEWFILVSVQQLWYDLRERMAFRNTREWTYFCESLWKELVLEVMKANYKITLNHFLKVSGLPASSQPKPEHTTPDAEVNVSTNANLGDTFALIQVENQANNNYLRPDSDSIPSIEEKSNSCQLAHVLKDDNYVLAEPNEPSVDETLCGLHEALLVSPSVADGISCITSGASNQGFSENDTDMAERRRATHSRLNATETWMPADRLLVSQAESCPGAITKYVLAGKKNGSPLVTDVRKHLLYHGWKLESKREERMVRWRYTSPTRHCYYSLYKICLDLMDHSGKRICSNTKEDRVVEPNVKDLGATKQKINHLGNVKREIMKPHFIEPEYCPQAVLDRSKAELGENHKSKRSDITMFGKKKRSDITLKAKRHLSSKGWKFHYESRSRNRSLSYTSPKRQKNVVEQERTGKPKRKRKDSFSYLPSDLVERQADLPVKGTGISSLKCGKSPAAVIKLSENHKGSRRNYVLRSTKRVQQVVTPSSLHQNPRTVLSWLIDHDIVLPRSKVHYWIREKGLKVEGRITCNGIICKCCDKVHSLSDFVAHGGDDNHRPAAKIFLEDGRSLLDCQIQVMQNSRVKFEKKKNPRLTHSCRIEPNDDVCSVCHYGGELILCDQCPSSFHESCLGLKTVPDGDWFCPSCCCGICGQSKHKEDGANIVDDSVLTCAQCAHKYHVSCIRSRGADRMEICAKENWFCCKKCEEISLGLHELLGRRIPVGIDNLTWTLIKSMEPDTQDLDVSDDEAMVENYSKLKIALEVMHECFEPVKESRTGRDLVSDIIFSRSSELNRLNFQGFYTILLERQDELITVANIRIHGEKVAEMPLIGTRFQYRRLGMCSILMNELEKKLMELGVERLILPAVPDVVHAWTGSFGFSIMSQSERLQFVDHTFLDFQDAIMCQKLLPRIVDGR